MEAALDYFRQDRDSLGKPVRGAPGAQKRLLAKNHRGISGDHPGVSIPDSCRGDKGLSRLQNGPEGVNWWAQQDSNLRPTDYESAALTN